ncbi:TPA: hypothetical protein ACRR3W_003752 [Providencia stuartii]|uniref:hypothetical protein n=1 Tax=Providencia sp. PROV267 TaxID=2949955 RepID=UPI00234B3DBE|nr:hypothetical protein [Providencia sp. PROV267]
MNEKQSQTLSAEKLYENALISIQLGIEDFKNSQLPLDDGGNPFRTLSAIRNLYAGMLLLFKYRIIISVNSEEEAYQLIFSPPHKILPHPDGKGGVIWKPDGKFKQTTIDVEGIKQRFEKFEIVVNWDAILKLQKSRNDLEHLHPRNSHGELANFVADLFPILNDFITNELSENPTELLGSSWLIMLEHQDFYQKKLTECKESWQNANIPLGMLEFLNECKCQECGSSLLMANSEDIKNGYAVDSDEDKFKYNCVSCNYSDLIAPLLINEFDHNFFYWPPNGDEPTYEGCVECMHDTFVIQEQECRWCGYELGYTRCNACDVILTQDDQDCSGLCGDCNYRMNYH